MKPKEELTIDVELNANQTSYFIKKYSISFNLFGRNKHNGYYNFITNKNKDFEIKKVTVSNQYFSFKKTKNFSLPCSKLPCIATFYILKNVGYKAVSYISNFVFIQYQLRISVDRIEALNENEFSESNFTLPGYNFLTFKYIITKFNKECIEILVENIHKIEICGKKEDYKYVVQKSESVTINLSIVFDPSSFLPEKTQNPPIEESRPVSTTSMQIVKPKWHEIMTNSKYFDVIILSSDNIEIPAHRCFLDKFSQKFADIIAESKEIPVKINIEKFNAEIIKASLEFLYDKLDSILGKESQVFKFATEYSIEILKETCCSHFEKTVNSENVCEFIQIAYNNGFEELKQKCQKHIALNKKDIDSTKLKELPKEIIVDIFCS